MNLEKHYPAPPPNVPVTLTQPSASFRAEIRNVIIAIIAFVITYLVMVVLAVMLAWFCLKAGLFVMVMKLHWLTLLLGIGIILMGALVIFFMIKFLFASSGKSADGGIQIQESDEPELFEFIRRIVGEVGTHFPRKIFLIPDVNASVFYNSSFWSLFFPTKKNLNIGLGLVNSVNVSEFKAVLAHEFGHFSQSSMSLGSYVYYVNQVIFNMLYRNNDWISAANGIASIHNILYFFVRLAAYIVQGVQWVLRGMYGIINRQYMSLSREMEFHADTISASVSGSNNMAQALRQVELGAETYHHTIEKCNELLASEKAPVNAYIGQRVVAAHIATVNNLPLKQGIPVVTSDFMSQRQHERINFKDQWASHPTRAEREANLNAIGIETPVLQESAWVVFQHPDKWQRELTDFLYRHIEMEINNVEDEAFANMMEEDRTSRNFPKMYQGYFDGHIMFTEKWAETEEKAQPKALNAPDVEALFSENLDNKIAALQQDIETLNAIGEGRIDTKSFDFDGQKYQKDQAGEIQTLLAKDLEKVMAARNQHDTDIAAAFYAHALATNPAKADALKAAYRAYNAMLALRNTCALHGQEIVATIHYVSLNDFHVATDMAQRFKELHSYHEPHLREFLQKQAVRSLLPADLQGKIKEVFLGTALQYHHYNEPHRHNLEKLRAATIEIGAYLEKALFDRQKEVLVLQAEMAP